MQYKVTPHLVELTFDAALKSFWRKAALRKFLRECKIAESHLSTWAEDESKRDFLDRTFSLLQKHEKGHEVISLMAKSLSEQVAFPDLRNWEDSSVKIADAEKSIRTLKFLLNQQRDDQKKSEEIEAAKNKSRMEHAELQKQRKTIETLTQRLTELTPAIGTQKGGYDFQDWFYSIIDYSEIENRRPYVTAGRQIDGSITIDGTTYLIELKFTKEQAGAQDIDIFKSKVESKADNTMGIFVSMSGYSSIAMQEASGKKTTLLLLDSSHLFLFLMNVMQLKEVIKRVRRNAAQTGSAYLATKDFSG